MKKVAVFGNGGGGKSTLARRLAEIAGLPLFPLDLIQYRVGGAKVPHEEYLQAHAELMSRETWVIDGYGCIATSWQRFAAADTLVYLDLPLPLHYFWVTKRFLKSPLTPPEGWPANSPMLRSTLDCYRVLWRCHRHLTPKYRALVAQTQLQAHKRVHHLRSPRQIGDFLADVREEFAGP